MSVASLRFNRQGTKPVFRLLVGFGAVFSPRSICSILLVLVGIVSLRCTYQGFPNVNFIFSISSLFYSTTHYNSIAKDTPQHSSKRLNLPSIGRNVGQGMRVL